MQIVLGISAVLTLACWVALWRGKDGVASKLVWMAISAAPVVGPLLFAALRDPPPVQPEVDRAVGPRDWDIPPTHHDPPP